MKKLLLLGSFLLLVACGAPTVDELLEDPELLQKVVMECENQNDLESEKCLNAAKALELTIKKMFEGFLQGE